MMPRLSVWYVRTALFYLLVGITLGALMLTAKAVPGWGWAWLHFPAHIELMGYGWMLQFALGIAFWALPRYPQPPKRGDERPVWAAWALLNAGILLLIAAAYASSSWLQTAGSIAEALAVLLFAIHAWPRIKPLGV